MSEAPFNMRQWAEDHDRRDEERFGMIHRILGAAAIALVAVSGWSLKAQYDGMQRQVEAAQVQLAAIQQVRTEVWRAAASEVSKPEQPR